MSAHQDSSGESSIRCGPCGFCLPQAELFRRFSLMEVQQTFYRPPLRKTVERWRQQAPESFEFTLKAFQAITHPGGSPTYRRAKLSREQRRECGHFRDTPTVRQAWEATLELATALRATVAVFQCPPQFALTEANVANMRRFFTWAERGELLFAWEPRHASWIDESIEELCRELELMHVVDPFERRSVFGSPRYFRLHGKPLGGFRYDYHYQYTSEQLDLLYQYCSAGPTYCLFNNTKMAEDIERFTRRVPRL